MAIDTQKTFDFFVRAGFDKKQAQALVEVERLKEDTQLATQQDMAELRNEIKQDIVKAKIWFLNGMLIQTITLVALMLSISIS